MYILYASYSTGWHSGALACGMLFKKAHLFLVCNLQAWLYWSQDFRDRHTCICQAWPTEALHWKQRWSTVLFAQWKGNNFS